jgi:hypothetical protein
VSSRPHHNPKAVPNAVPVPGSVKRTTLARRIGVSASSLYTYLDGTTLPTR